MKLLRLPVIPAKKVPVSLFFILYLISSATASFELGYGLGSMGFKYEVSHKFSESFNVRLGSSEFENIASNGIYTNGVSTVNDMLFNQNTTFDLKQLSLLIDYHPWRADIRFTGGITKNKILLEVLNYGDRYFIINNYTFSDQLVDSTELTMQLTNGISPYFGIGWSTGFDQKSGLSFSGDLGFYYAADFALNFSAKCTKNATSFQCANISAQSLQQQRQLRNDSGLQILPMVGALLSYKF